MPYFEHDGLRLHYREDGTGTLVIMLPGNTASSAHFAHEIERLRSAYHVVALDFRGTGQSQRLAEFEEDWLIESANDVAALIEHLGAKDAILMGTSGGALPGLLCAALHPDRIRAVVADSFVPRWEVEMLRTRVAERLSIIDQPSQFWEMGHGTDWRQVVATDTDWLKRMAERGGVDITPELAQISCPVLLTGSLSDSMLPYLAAQMTATLPLLSQGELYLCQQGNHPLIWSAPDHFWGVTMAFLKRIDL